MGKRVELILVDVQNTLHAVGELRHLLQQDVDAARERLAQLLRVFPQVWLFEDGGPAQCTALAAGLWRVRGGGSADDALVGWLLRHPQSRAPLVVTGDQDLAIRARSQGASVVHPVDFWRRHHRRMHRQQRSRQATNQGDEKPLSPGEVAMWLDYFTEDDS